MIWSRSSRSDKGKKKAQEDYEQAVQLADKPDRESRILCVRVALKCRANLDTAFVRAAREISEYDEKATLALAKGQDKPDRPVADSFQLVKVGEEFIYTYIPSKFADAIFSAGSAYQTLMISREQAIERGQSIANEMWDELGLTEKFEVLRFLRDDEAEQTAGT
jgi:hypothetical protein